MGMKIVIIFWAKNGLMNGWNIKKIRQKII